MLAAKYQPEESTTMLPLTLEKGLIIDLGATPVAKSQPVTIKNTGKKPVTVRDVKIGPPFLIEKNGCEGEIAAGGKCEIVVRFEPKNKGGYSVALSVSTSSNYSQDLWYVPVKALMISAATLKLKGDFTFGEAVTGKKTDRKFTLTNDGDAKAEAVEVSLANPGHFSISKSDCTATLDPGKSCVMSVSFEAKSDGMHQDILKVGYKAGLDAISFEHGLAGVGLKPAKLALTIPEAGSLGTKILGMKLEFDWILSNLGDVVADRIEEGSSTKAPFSYRKRGFPGDGGNCKRTLGPRESCRVSATFGPLFQGDALQEFTVKYFDGRDNQSVATTFTGSGLTPARIAVKEPAPGAMQPVLVTKGTDRRFHMINEGQSEASDISLVPNDFGNRFKVMQLIQAEEGELCKDKKVLKPGESCEFAVSFLSDKGGDFEASVGIKFTDGLRQQVTRYPFRARALSTARVAFEEKAGLVFGKVLPNESKTMLLKINNEGEHRVEHLTIEGLGDNYSLKAQAEGDLPHKVCTDELDDGKACVYPIEFKNVGGGTADRTIKFKFFDGLKDSEVSYQLKANGLKSARLDLAEGDKVDFGEVLATGEVEKEVKIKNSGDMVVRDLQLKVVADQEKSPFVSGNNTCVETLDAGKTCVVKIKFAPADPGDYTAKIKLGYADEQSGEKSTDFPLVGKSKLPAKLTFSPDKIDFGNVVSGEEVEKTLTLKNEGAANAQNIAINFGGASSGYSWKGGQFPGDGGDCKDSLESKANCTVVIAYKDLAGKQSSASLITSYKDGIKAQRLEVAMGGNSVVPGKVAFDKSVLDFGLRAIGGKNIETVSLKNAGGAEVEFLSDSTALSGFSFVGGKFPGEGGNCEMKLAKDATCKIAIEMKGEHEESFDGNLVMAYKDIVTPKSDLALPIAGSLRAPAVIVTDGETDFGQVFVGETKSISFDIKNDGGFDTLVKVSMSESTVKLDSSNCQTLKGHDRCTINAVFAPSAGKALDAKVSIKYPTGIDQKELVVALKGTASKLARISLGKSVLDFGNVKATEKKNKLLTLKNEGDVEATGIEISGIKDEVIGFDGSYPGKTGNCTDTLKAGAECVIDISFAPTAAGTSEQNLEVKYNNGKDSVTAPVMVRGLADAAPGGEQNRGIASDPAH
ncbi:MAG: choice-of-anchor D domain-containing protein [Deltaproteobacteria bacterium]|nr:choice-of-anchor D domain-containing protein [Deltaproteobacteria bacterium]MBI3296260.1 choice-of-anchor D domain-containing protein [Deltaproteobacteria bacterium]